MPVVDQIPSETMIREFETEPNGGRYVTVENPDGSVMIYDQENPDAWIRLDAVT